MERKTVTILFNTSINWLKKVLLILLAVLKKVLFAALVLVVGLPVAVLLASLVLVVGVPIVSYWSACLLVQAFKPPKDVSFSIDLTNVLAQLAIFTNRTAKDSQVN